MAALSLSAVLSVMEAPASVLYSNAGPFAINEADPGVNLPGFAVSRDDTASDILYFRFALTDLFSHRPTEPYFAGFNLFDGINGTLGIGNALGGVAYSAYTGPAGGFLADLNSSTPDGGQPWQSVFFGNQPTIVFKVQFVPGANDNITAWLNPNLALSEGAQAASLTTNFSANATFDQIHLRESGGGNGWTFQNIAVVTTGTDPGFFAVPEPGALLLVVSGMAVSLSRRRKA